MSTFNDRTILREATAAALAVYRWAERTQAIELK